MSDNKMSDKYLFVEKYRPQTIEDVALPEEFSKTFRKYIKDREIPHLLLIGVQGSGKTTMARILIDSIITDKRSDCLQLNGSSHTGIDVVRNLIEEFLKVPAFGGDSKIKIVFIDEFDYMSQNAQAALRNIIEKYGDTARFLLTANYRSKIIDPLFSRVTEFQFKKLPMEFVRAYTYKVLNSEKIKFDESFIDKCVAMHYPDVRRIINTLQGKIDEGEIVSNYESLVSNEKKAISYVKDLQLGLQNKSSKDITVALSNTESLLKESELDYTSLYNELFIDATLPIWLKIKINSYANGSSDAMIPAMNYMSMLYDICRVGKEFYALKK